MGDGRTYDYTIGIRADAYRQMTSDFLRLQEVLQVINARIVNRSSPC